MKNRTKWLIAGVMAVGLAGISNADLIGFTSGEGYVDGELNAQKNWVASTANGGFVVDATAGSVRRAANWGDARYKGLTLLGGGSGDGDTASASVDFYFEGTLNAANTTILASFGFEATDDSNTGQVMSVGSSAYLDGYLRLRDNSFADFSPAVQVALPGEDNLLRIEYTLTLGSDASSSVLSATLSNLVSGASMEASYTGVGADFYTAATTGSGLSFRMANGALSGNTAIVFKEVSVIPEPATLGLFILSGSACLFVRRRCM